MSPPVISELKALGESIAKELVFSEPGTDLGLLPINSLLSQIEDFLAQKGAPAELLPGAKLARGWIDEALETSGTFSKATLDRFGEWVNWWQAALVACDTQSPVAECPNQWSSQEPVSNLDAAKAETPITSQEEPQIHLNLVQDAELLGQFLNEAQEHLQNIEQGALVLETNPSDAETLNSVFRAFHTFKGGAGFLNLVAIQNLAHQLESLLDQARQKKLSITPAIVSLILSGGDTLKQFLVEIQSQLTGAKPSGPISLPTLSLLDAIGSVLAGIGLSQPAVPASPPAEGGRIATGGPTAPPISGAAASGPAVTSAAVPKARSTPGQSKPEVAASHAGPGPIREKGEPVSSAVKVNTQKLDNLVDLVGEMVIAQSLVVQNPELRLLGSEQLTRDLAHLGRITKDLQRTVMALRMVPIRATFQKMQRVVRDCASKLGKHLELVTEGEDTELDRTIVEEISDPLIHMIRNAADHGIEEPALRRERGKPEQGTIRLRAFHQGGSIVIEIQDDGKGLDRERILAKALEKGLVMPGEALADSQVFNLIMGAGFSTAQKVTDLSGRGVGMDVVRRNIEKLRGKIEIQSLPGRGSTFSIYLPLTLAIIDGLLIGVGNQRYILPTLLVRESFRPAADMIKTVNGRGEMVSVRGRLLPLLRLYEHLGVSPSSTDPQESLIVVVEAGRNARGVLVDKLLGKQEVVIKSLGEGLPRNRCIAGAAILGDGQVGLILDPHALINLESAPMAAVA